MLQELPAFYLLFLAAVMHLHYRVMDNVACCTLDVTVESRKGEDLNRKAFRSLL